MKSLILYYLSTRICASNKIGHLYLNVFNMITKVNK